jgi:hypothetical protein
MAEDLNDRLSGGRRVEVPADDPYWAMRPSPQALAEIADIEQRIAHAAQIGRYILMD